MVKDEASPSKGNAYLQHVVSIIWWFTYWDTKVWQRDSLSLNKIKIEMEYIRIWKRIYNRISIYWKRNYEKTFQEELLGGKCCINLYILYELIQLQIHSKKKNSTSNLRKGTWDLIYIYIYITKTKNQN